MDMKMRNGPHLVLQIVIVIKFVQIIVHHVMVQIALQIMAVNFIKIV